MDDASVQVEHSERSDDDSKRHEHAKFELALAHCKYMYEEEKERRDVLNRTTRVYLAAFAFSVGGAMLKINSIERLPVMVEELARTAGHGPLLSTIAITLIYLAAILFCLAFVFTILVVRVWQWERLSDPKAFASTVAPMQDESRLLAAMIADYVVATERNYLINEQKAVLLSRALKAFLGALGTFVFTLVYVTSLV